MLGSRWRDVAYDTFTFVDSATDRCVVPLSRAVKAYLKTTLAERRQNTLVFPSYADSQNQDCLQRCSRTVYEIDRRPLAEPAVRTGFGEQLLRRNDERYTIEDVVHPAGM